MVISRFLVFNMDYLFLHKMVYNLSIKAVSSAVERLPYKQVVTGSNPVPPIPYRYNLIGQGSSSKGLGQGPSKSLM